jgi:hypothetical protein
MRALTSVSLTPTLIFAFVVLIAGCGDSIDGVSLSPAQSTPPTQAGGVWYGSLANDLTGESFALSGVITEDNTEGRFVTDGGQMFVLRDISGTGGEISATVSAFARPEAAFLDGSIKTSGTLTGSLVERTRIEGDWSLNTGETGTVTLVYDDVYERGSDIARLAGIWEAASGTVYTVDALGEIFGQTERGCVYWGRIYLIDATCNVYRVRINGGCLAINASGLGLLTYEFGTNDAFVMMLDLGNGWWFTEQLLRL